MSRDELQDVMLGAVVVALLYAFYKHAKTAAAPVFSVNNPINPPTGTSYDPANPGAYIPLSSLLSGTVHDITTGQTQNYASTADVTQQALQDIYNVPNSLVRVPDANYY
jgi:hypothetical protein